VDFQTQKINPVSIIADAELEPYLKRIADYVGVNLIIEDFPSEFTKETTKRFVFEARKVSLTVAK
jgi:uncharacterized UPF0146 family protein